MTNYIFYRHSHKSPSFYYWRDNMDIWSLTPEEFEEMMNDMYKEFNEENNE